MIRLVRYLIESLEKDYDEIVDKLSKIGSLKDYVDYLNDMIDDPDANKLLTKIFIDSQEKNNIKYKGSIISIKCKDLITTQSDIDLDKSIAFLFKNKDSAISNISVMGNKENVKTHFPVITFNKKYILDGHHRWAKVYAFCGKDAKIECFDIKVDSNKQVSYEDMLKILQSLVAIKYSENNESKKIPSSKVKGIDIFKASENEIRKSLEKLIYKDEEITKILLTGFGLDDADQLLDTLVENISELKDGQERYARQGNKREFMPQLDKAGNNPKDKASAMPNIKGSVLNTLTTARTDKNVI